MAFFTACFGGGTLPTQQKKKRACKNISGSSVSEIGKGSKKQEEAHSNEFAGPHSADEDAAVTLGTGPRASAMGYDPIRRVSCGALSAGQYGHPVLAEGLRSQNPSGIMAQELRSAMIMESSPAIITVLSYQGTVLHQNPLSKVYFGNRVSGGSYDFPDDVLSLLFAHDPVKGHRMLNEISKAGIGGVWKAVVRVPPTLNSQKKEGVMVDPFLAYQRPPMLREPSRSVDLTPPFPSTPSRLGGAAASSPTCRRLNYSSTADGGQEDCHLAGRRPLSWISTTMHGAGTSRFQPLQRGPSGASTICAPCLPVDSSSALGTGGGGIGGCAGALDLLNSPQGSVTTLPFTVSGRRETAGAYNAPPRRNSSASRSGTSCRWGPMAAMALAPTASETSVASYSVMNGQQDPLATSTFATFNTTNHNVNPTTSIPSTRDLMTLIAAAAAANGTSSNLELPAQPAALAIGPARTEETDTAAATGTAPANADTRKANATPEPPQCSSTAEPNKAPVTRRKPTRTTSCYVLGTSTQHLSSQQPQSPTVSSRALAFALSLGTSPMNPHHLPPSSVASLGARQSRAASVTSIGFRPFTAIGSNPVGSTAGVATPVEKTWNLPTGAIDTIKCDTATATGTGTGTGTETKSLRRLPTRAQSFVGRPFKEAVTPTRVTKRLLLHMIANTFAMNSANNANVLVPRTAPSSLTPDSTSHAQQTTCGSNPSLPSISDSAILKHLPVERSGHNPHDSLLDAFEHPSVRPAAPSAAITGAGGLGDGRMDGPPPPHGSGKSPGAAGLRAGNVPGPGGDDDYMASPFKARLTGLEFIPSAVIPTVMHSEQKASVVPSGPASAPPWALRAVSAAGPSLPSLSLPLTTSVPKLSQASSMLTPASVPASSQAVPECWHEVWATAARDPVSGEDVIVLTQMDVTGKVVAERHLALVMETEHRLVEQLFPRHILQYITEEWTAAEREAGEEATGAEANTEHGHQGLRRSGTMGGKSLRWRPVIRDCNALATWHPEVTLLFADIKGFTPMCKEVEPRQVMALLNSLYSRYDSMLDEYGVFKVETIGDCYFVAGGLIHEDEDGMAAVRDGGGNEDPLHAERVYMFAKAMLSAARQVRLPTTGEPVEIRIGLHTGPVVSGVVGTRMPRFCLFGDTVNTASRMESTGVPGAIHASDATFKRLAARDGWEPTGGIEVKGKGLMSTYIWNPSKIDGLRLDNLGGLESTASYQGPSGILDRRGSGLQSGITMRLPQATGGNRSENCGQRQEAGVRSGGESGEQSNAYVMLTGSPGVHQTARPDTIPVSSFAGFRPLQLGIEEGGEKGSEHTT